MQSLLSFLWLLLIPKEPGNALILGYSLRRLALLIPLSLPLIGALLIQWGLNKYANWRAWLVDEDKKPKTAALLAGGGFLIAAVVWSFAFLFHFMCFFPDLGAYIRLLPLLVCYLLLGIEAILFVPLALYPIKRERRTKKHAFPLAAFLVTFIVLIAGLLVVAITGWGIDPERVSIISLGAPLLEGQVWYIAGLLTLLMAAAFAWACIPKKSRPGLRGKADLVVALVLWLIAVVLWMSLPLPKNNYFAPPVQAPNFEKYPFSDAEQYDLSSLYVYYGSLKDFVVSKPLYVSLLALLHTLVGLSYDRIILLQTLLVALFPAVLYLIGKELHSRLGGIAIALFAIMREVAAIQATSMADVSSTKLLLSDMPAALLASVLALALIHWFKAGGKKVSGHEFIIGGLIGAFILTRIQTMVLVPFVLVLVVIRYFRSFKSILLSALVLLLAVGLVVTPVLLRNHAITGVYWVDNPSSSSGLSRIMTKGLEVEEDISDMFSPEDPLQKNKAVIGSLLKNNLIELIGFTADNFMRNETSTFLTLPIRLGNRTPFLDYLTINKPFWVEVYSQPNLLNIMVFLINSALIALGFAVVFRRNPWAVLAVIGFHFIYSLSSAVVRLSGWRFILPVDWVLYAFYALGLAEGLTWIYRKVAGWNLTPQATWLADYPADKQKNSRGWAAYAMYGVLFIFIGAAIPLRENLLPPLTPEYTKSEVCQTIEAKIMESEYALLAEGFSEFCISDNTRALYGFGIYPRYFKSGEGFYNRSYDPWFGKQPYARLVFRMIGSRNGKIYIKTENEALHFPNGTLVYAVGRDKTKFEAQVVLVEGQQTELLISSAILSGEEKFKTGN
ncbi:MAG: hypothetical protein Q8N39_08320 [Pelolinea sp.]|nr:hypothetical protein [Pelolinea sp.]